MSNEDSKTSNEHGNSNHDEVTIHIDKKMYKSPNPTTGKALYELANVNTQKYDLFREVPGKGDDEFIPNDGTEIKLKNGDHFNTVQKELNPGGY